jgi:hypothetical protein
LLGAVGTDSPSVEQTASKRVNAGGIASTVMRALAHGRIVSKDLDI